MAYIKLTDAELHICRILGMMRRSEAMHKVVDQQVGKDCTWAIDIDGVVAEYCAAKVMNLCPDLTVSIRNGGADLVGRSGQTIDVKSTRYKTGRLLATLKKSENPCDLYVLVIVDDFGGDVVGWIRSSSLFQESNKVDLGHGLGYGVTQDLLSKFN